MNSLKSGRYFNFFVSELSNKYLYNKGYLREYTFDGPNLFINSSHVLYFVSIKYLNKGNSSGVYTSSVVVVNSFIIAFIL